jgi:pimeloyl-ACP methyl ester carboxylesterase
MVQLVFVHGVATRDGPEYQDGKSKRDTLLKAALLRQEDANILNPLWGNLMPPLAFGGASFAKDKVKALSLTGGMAATIPPADPTTTSVLPRIAATSPASAIDLLFAERISMPGVPLSNADVRAFVAAVDMLDPGGPGDTASLASAKDDDAFVRQLRQLSGHAVGLGIGDTLLDAAKSLADRVRNVVSNGAYDVIVEPLNPLVAEFLGDVFRYLKAGDLRTAIRAKVCEDLVTAWGARKANEKLVLIGHSLGGVILYDMLSEPQAAGLPQDFKADALVTVGSQPGLFQELGLFDHTPSPQAGVGAAGPAATGLWINTFDPIDPFGFPTKPMFSLPDDYSFNSVTGLVSAHTTYFIRPQFYARLRRRLIDARILS